MGSPSNSPITMPSKYVILLMALLAIGGALVGFHLAGKIAPLVNADDRGDEIGEHRLHQRFGIIVPFDFNDLGELCVVTRIAYNFLYPLQRPRISEGGVRGGASCWIVPGASAARWRTDWRHVQNCV